ncbi:MAG: glycine cleavage system protein R [Acidimicrobiales bacterium]
MRQIVITVIGDDRAGLVGVLSGAIADNGGNWERSQMAELAGVFAGVVLASVPESGVDGLSHELAGIESQGLLHISMANVAGPDDSAGGPGRPGGTTGGARLSLRLVGQDHPGIVHEISSTLAERNVSIDELETAVVPAPMGGMLFEAKATLEAPEGVSVGDVQDALEALAQDLMVDVDLSSSPGDGQR